MTCDSIIDDVPDEPVRNNTSDSGGENPRLPELASLDLNGQSIINNLGSRVNLSTDQISLTWTLTSDGVQDGIEIVLKLAEPGASIESPSYTAEITGSRFDLPFRLNETFNQEVYQAQIEISLPENASVESRTYDFQISVNTITGPSFVLTPTTVTESNGVSFAQVFLDEILESHDITAYRLDLVIAQNSFEITTRDISVFTDSDSFLFREGAQIIQIKEIIGDTLRINSGVLGANLPPISGSGPLLELYLDTNGASGLEIQVSPTSVLKRGDGTEVPIGELDVSFISN